MTDFEDRLREGLAELDRAYAPSRDLPARIARRTRQRERRHHAGHGVLGCAAVLTLVLGLASALGLTSSGQGSRQAGPGPRVEDSNSVPTSHQSTATSGLSTSGGTQGTTATSALTALGVNPAGPGSPDGGSGTTPANVTPLPSIANNTPVVNPPPRVGLPPSPPTPASTTSTTPTTAPPTTSSSTTTSTTTTTTTTVPCQATTTTSAATPGDTTTT